MITCAWQSNYSTCLDDHAAILSPHTWGAFQLLNRSANPNLACLSPPNHVYSACSPAPSPCPALPSILKLLLMPLAPSWQICILPDTMGLLGCLCSTLQAQLAVVDSVDVRPVKPLKHAQLAAWLALTFTELYTGKRTRYATPLSVMTVPSVGRSRPWAVHL